VQTCALPIYIIRAFPHYLSDTLAKFRGDVFITHRCIFDYVVENGSYWQIRVGAIRCLNYEIKHLYQMIKVWLLRCTFAPLVAMRLRSETPSGDEDQHSRATSPRVKGSFVGHASARRARPRLPR